MWLICWFLLFTSENIRLGICQIEQFQTVFQKTLCYILRTKHSLASFIHSVGRVSSPDKIEHFVHTDRDRETELLNLSLRDF